MQVESGPSNGGEKMAKGKRTALADHSDNDNNTITYYRVKSKLLDWRETDSGIYVLSEDPRTIAVFDQTSAKISPVRSAAANALRPTLK